MVDRLMGIKPTTHSIPHNRATRQAEFQTNCKDSSNTPKPDKHPPEQTELTRLQEQAHHLYKSGLNIFPQPLGKKAGLPWKPLQYARLDEKHSQYGLDPIFRGKCNLAVMCGKTSGNLFVIDCETPESFKHHQQEIRRRQIPLWAVATARGGHIYLRCQSGEVANIDKGTLPDTEIKGCRRYVLAPPSIHPSGITYEWTSQEGTEPPTVTLSEINWLKDENDIPVILRPDQPQPTRKTSHKEKSVQTKNDDKRLSRTTQDYLTNGHLITEGTRNNRLFSASCDMAGNNLAYNETQQQLVPIATASGLSEQEAQRTIQSAYSKSRTPARPPKQPQPKKGHNWEHILAYIQNQQWKGRTGNSERAVLLALTERYRVNANKNGVFRASIREISSLARISTATTQKTLKNLLSREQPIIFRAGSDRMSNASLWKFSNSITEQGKQLTLNTESPPPWLSVSVSLFNSTDVGECGALGANGLLVYSVLSTSVRPLMPRNVASVAHLEVYQVNYVLRKLSSFGLVERCSDGWVAVSVTPGELDESVSSRVGKLGSGAARRARFARERAIYAGRLILLARFRMEGRDFYMNPVLSGMIEETPSFVEQEISFGSSLSFMGARVADGRVKFWRCPNCGQSHFAEDPPDMCDFCRDFTTWQLCAEEVTVASSDSCDGDSLVALALELGAEVYVYEEVDSGDADLCSDAPPSRASPFAG